MEAYRLALSEAYGEAYNGSPYGTVTLHRKACARFAIENRPAPHPTLAALPNGFFQETTL
jgi:hypothetical protein